MRVGAQKQAQVEEAVDGDALIDSEQAAADREHDVEQRRKGEGLALRCVVDEELSVGGIQACLDRVHEALAVVVRVS